MEKTIKQADAFICGGGPVGLMLATGLALKGYSVVLAESTSMSDPAKTPQGSFDGRVLALSHGSKLVLEQLQLWEDIRPYVTEIQHVHVSQKGYLGVTTLDAQEVGVAALGYSVQSSDLGKVLWQHVSQHANIEVLCPAKLLDFTEKGNRVYATVQDDLVGEIEVRTGLLVGADGTNSQVRKILGLPLQKKSYHAFGVVAQIKTEQHPQGWSYERFTEQGPVALLPMHDHFHKAVLVCPEEVVDEVMALDDEAFTTLFAEKMGERLGAYTQVSKRVAYPLNETYVGQMNSGRAILMGNASHTQHPVAAQGLNLGVRDIEVFLNGLSPEIDIGSPNYLSDYAAKRKMDHESVMGLTDSLIQVFQHGSPVVGHLRGLGLMAMQAMPGLRKRFARFAMGGRR